MIRLSSLSPLFLMVNLCSAGPLLAAGDAYVPGAPPSHNDMLTPDQVSTAGISSKPTNDSGLYLGIGGSLGQGRTTDGGSTPGTAFLFHVEPGYQFGSSSWSRLEVGLDLFGGHVGYRLPDDSPLGGAVTYPGLYGALAKFGYGYSLGGTMFGVLKAGVGPVFAKFQVDMPNDKTAKSDAISGIAWMLAWDVVAPISHSVDAIFGISWMQMQFDVSKVSSDSGSVHVDRTMIANVPSVDLGLRLRF